MGTRPYDTLVSIYECDKDYYLLQDWKSSGPSKLSLAKIQLDAVTLNELKD